LRCNPRPEKWRAGRQWIRNPSDKPQLSFQSSSTIRSELNPQVYLAGDGGYDTHFAEIGRRFAPIDLAVVENGQYNADWRYIHLMPEKLPDAIRDLRPARVLTVHHSKFALSRHAWDEPLKNAAEAAAGDGFVLLQPMIGEIVPLADTVRRYEAWWRGID